MKVARSFLLATVISTSLAFIFYIGLHSYLSPPYQGERGEPVFQMIRPIELDREALVTFLKQIPVDSVYKRVRLREDELFIDFIRSDVKGTHEEVYADAYLMLNMIFARTKNIDRVYLRFIYQKGYHPELILAASSQRSEELMQYLAQGVELSAEEFLSRFAHLVYGTGWRKY